ncbi:MAG: hypothetical protein ACREDD_00950 [Methylocella sp.]
MSRKLCIAAGFAVGAVFGLQFPDVALAQQSPQASRPRSLADVAKPRLGLPNLNPTSNGHTIHIMPTVKGAAALARLAPDSGPLEYSGGPIMPTVNLYAIYWAPPTLQNGTPVTLPVTYKRLQKRLLKDYPQHGIGNITTQYNQTGPTLYPTNDGDFNGDFFVDTSPYPASTCSDTARPGNCITDANIQAEITKVMGIKGWVGELNNIFLVYTTDGEGSCVDSSSTNCAYTQYCAYHSFFGPTAAPVIYANMPFGDTSACQNFGQPSPNGDAVADAVTSTASHEITESITDPLLNAWFTAMGNEIGDLCAYNYGTNSWNSMVTNDANQNWNGHFYELQMEFDNHANGCAQVGPL